TSDERVIDRDRLELLLELFDAAGGIDAPLGGLGLAVERGAQALDEAWRRRLGLQRLELADRLVEQQRERSEALQPCEPCGLAGDALALGLDPRLLLARHLDLVDELLPVARTQAQPPFLGSRRLVAVERLVEAAMAGALHVEDALGLRVEGAP